MKHRRWRALVERLPPEVQAEVDGNTAKALAELDRAEQEQRDERSHDDRGAGRRPRPFAETPRAHAG